MTDHSALIERLEAGAKQTITRYCGDLNGAIVSHDILAEAAAALRDMTEWRDIASAPKDGTEVLIFAFPNEVPTLRPLICAAFWQAESTFMAPGYWRLRHSVGPSFKPTHWLPLPSAPNHAKEGGE